MIRYIKGTIQHIDLESIIIECNGIGYLVFFSHPEAVSLNKPATIYTYHYVREDEMSLYGFLSKEELDFFIKLISVKGLGCKTANTILGFSTVDKLLNAIEKSDIQTLKQLPGVGSKTASQIILDLKGKLVSVSKEDTKLNAQLLDALQALKSLGYKASELIPIQKELSSRNDMSTDEYIKLALKLIQQWKGL